VHQERGYKIYRAEWLGGHFDKDTGKIFKGRGYYGRVRVERSYLAFVQSDPRRCHCQWLLLSARQTRTQHYGTQGYSQLTVEQPKLEARPVPCAPTFQYQSTSCSNPGHMLFISVRLVLYYGHATGACGLYQMSASCVGKRVLPLQ
jgi:hypothetical protein